MKATITLNKVAPTDAKIPLNIARTYINNGLYIFWLELHKYGAAWITAPI